MSRSPLHLKESEQQVEEILQRIRTNDDRVMTRGREKVFRRKITVDVEYERVVKAFNDGTYYEPNEILDQAIINEIIYLEIHSRHH